jgi:hypothetical protein
VQQQYGSDTIRTTPAVETGPITPAQALKRYGEYLTAYEQSEILQYQHVSTNHAGRFVAAAAVGQC